MKMEPTNRSTAGKVVIVGTRRQDARGQELFFIFTSRQVDEVMLDFSCRPIPFAGDFLQGLGFWRGRIVPSLDLGCRLGFRDNPESSRGSFLVVKEVGSGNQQLVRCVLKVVGEIRTNDVGELALRPVDPRSAGLDPALVKGVYEQDRKIFVIPDLYQILRSG